MKTFSATQTYTFKNLFWETSLIMLIIVIIFIGILIWLPERLTIFTLIVPTILLLKYFYDNASRQRLQQLTFDNEKNEVIVIFKSLISGVEQIRLSFDKARLEVVEEKGKLKVFEPLKLYLMKEKMEIFELTKSKDSLSVDTLQDIIRAADECAIPIIRK